MLSPQCALGFLPPEDISAPNGTSFLIESFPPLEGCVCPCFAALAAHLAFYSSSSLHKETCVYHTARGRSEDVGKCLGVLCPKPGCMHGFVGTLQPDEQIAALNPEKGATYQERMNAHNSNVGAGPKPRAPTRMCATTACYCFENLYKP